MFESGSVFGKNIENQQKRMSAGLFCGWERSEVMQILSDLLSTLGHIQNPRFIQSCPPSHSHIYHPNKSAMYLDGEKEVLSYGYIHPKLAELYKLPKNTLLFEIHSTDFVLENQASYQQLPKYPGIMREVNFVMPEQTASADICKKIQNVDSRIAHVCV